MLSRPLVMTGLLGAAVAAPIAMTEGPKHFGSLGATASPEATAPATALPSSTIEAPGDLLYQSPAPLESVGFVSLHEMLRMDVSKEWVYSRWARKSTGLADPGLFGVRVPVVTGTQMTDLAGSMSYYFNSAGQVDRLRFHGRTADTTALIQLLQTYYGLQPRQATAGEQLYQSLEGGKVQGELRTRPEAVLWSTTPHRSFVVDIELNRPGSGRYVEPKLLTPELPPAPEPPKPPVQTAETPAQSALEPAAEAADAPAELLKAKRPGFRWPY